MEWYTGVFKKYATFSGRARRKEYWTFYLYNIIVTVLLSLLASLIDFFSMLTAIYGLVIIVPSIAVAVRRLHDIGKPGVWYCLAFIPCIGTIWLIILLATEGETGDNMYGPDPKMDNSNIYDM